MPYKRVGREKKEVIQALARAVEEEVIKARATARQTSQKALLAAVAEVEERVKEARQRALLDAALEARAAETKPAEERVLEVAEAARHANQTALLVPATIIAGGVGAAAVGAILVRAAIRRAGTAVVAGAVGAGTQVGLPINPYPIVAHMTARLLAQEAARGLAREEMVAREAVGRMTIWAENFAARRAIVEGIDAGVAALGTGAAIAAEAVGTGAQVGLPINPYPIVAPMTARLLAQEAARGLAREEMVAREAVGRIAIVAEELAARRAIAEGMAIGAGANTATRIAANAARFITKSAGIIVVGSSLVPYVAASISANMKATEHFEESLRLLKHGSLPEALDRINAAIDLCGVYPPYYLVRGDIYARQNMYNRALGSYEAVLRYNGWWYCFAHPFGGSCFDIRDQARFNIGRILYDTQKFIEALDAFGGIRNPSFDSLYASAEALFNLGRHTEAIKKYKAAQKLNNKSDEVYYGLGRSYSAVGDYSRAVKELKKSLSLNNSSSLYHSLLGNIYYQSGEYQSALQSFKTALTLDRSDSRIYSDFGDVYMVLGKYKEALVMYEFAVNLDSTNPDFHYKLAEASFYLESYHSAIGGYEAAIRLDDKNWVYFKHLAKALFKSGRHTEALGSFEKSIVLNLDDEKFFDLGEYRTMPKETLNPENLFCLYFELGQYDEALEVLDQAKDKDIAYYDRSIAALYKSGRFTEAMIVTEKASALYGNQYPLFPCNGAIIAHELARYAESEYWLESCEKGNSTLFAQTEQILLGQPLEMYIRDVHC